MYLHGAGARASGLLDSGLAREVSACGNAFGAPVGYHPDSRFVRNWSMRARESSFERDDAIFLREVLADVQSQPGVADTAVLLAGLSRYGSMVWDIACLDPSFATDCAPLAGAFWDDLPKSCAAAVMPVHTHGGSDRAVLLERRSFGGGV